MNNIRKFIACKVIRLLMYVLPDCEFKSLMYIFIKDNIKKL